MTPGHANACDSMRRAEGFGICGHALVDPEGLRTPTRASPIPTTITATSETTTNHNNNRMPTHSAEASAAGRAPPSSEMEPSEAEPAGLEEQYQFLQTQRAAAAAGGGGGGGAGPQRRRRFELHVRQQPRHARCSGLSEKGADRRPLDPLPILQLRLGPADADDPDGPEDAARDGLAVALAGAQPPPAAAAADADADADDGNSNNQRRLRPRRSAAAAASTFLHNPFIFVYASLVDAAGNCDIAAVPDAPAVRALTGSIASSLYRLRDLDNSYGGFFVFPDISIRIEGDFRLKFTLFEILAQQSLRPSSATPATPANSSVVSHCSVCSDVFTVYQTKFFPGMSESSPLAKLFAEQGLKIRVRKDPFPGATYLPSDSLSAAATPLAAIRVLPDASSPSLLARVGGSADLPAPASNRRKSSKRSLDDSFLGDDAVFAASNATIGTPATTTTASSTHSRPRQHPKTAAYSAPLILKRDSFTSCSEVVTISESMSSVGSAPVSTPTADLPGVGPAAGPQSFHSYYQYSALPHPVHHLHHTPITQPPPMQHPYPYAQAPPHYMHTTAKGPSAQLAYDQWGRPVPLTRYVSAPPYATYSQTTQPPPPPSSSSMPPSTSPTSSSPNHHHQQQPQQQQPIVTPVSTHYMYTSHPAITSAHAYPIHPHAQQYHMHPAPNGSYSHGYPSARMSTGGQMQHLQDSQQQSQSQSQPQQQSTPQPQSPHERQQHPQLLQQHQQPQQQQNTGDALPDHDPASSQKPIYTQQPPQTQPTQYLHQQQAYQQQYPQQYVQYAHPQPHYYPHGPHMPAAHGQPIPMHPNLSSQPQPQPQPHPYYAHYYQQPVAMPAGSVPPGYPPYPQQYPLHPPPPQYAYQ